MYACFLLALVASEPYEGVFPEAAETASQAIELILKAPVWMEIE